MSDLDEIDLNIQRKGRAWTTTEVVGRLDLFPARAESIDGKLFWTEEERLTALALLLENVGIDKAVRLGDAELWRRAIEELVEARKR